MNKYYSKIFGFCLVITLALVISFGLSTQKVLAEESITNTSTENISTATTSAKKTSPYSAIKERIQELQQKMKTGNEQKMELTTTKEINARKQPLINAVRNTEKIENKGEEKQIREEVKEQKKEEMKQKLEENSIKRIRAYTEKIVNRFNTVIERFIILSNRAEDRIKKIEEGGILLTDSKVLLSKTREEMTATKTKIGEISKKIEEMIVSENPKEMFKNSKEIFNDVNESIKTVHKSLVELIKSIKAGVEENGDSTKLEN